MQLFFFTYNDQPVNLREIVKVECYPIRRHKVCIFEEISAYFPLKLHLLQVNLRIKLSGKLEGKYSQVSLKICILSKRIEQQLEARVKFPENFVLI